VGKERQRSSHGSWRNRPIVHPPDQGLIRNASLREYRKERGEGATRMVYSNHDYASTEKGFVGRGPKEQNDRKKKEESSIEEWRRLD